ncbi:MAG: GNAT family N-acetyltransferase [Vicinamibacteria bacterium]
MQPAGPERSPGAPAAATVIVRTAGAADLEFIRVLCRQLFLEFGSYDRYVEDWFGEKIVSTGIAEADSARAGFFMLAIHPPAVETDPAVGELLAIAVLPELQSKGIGLALLDRALALARESPREVHEVRLSVAEGNARAQRMFARRGFRVGSAAGIYPAGQRALFMTKVLKKEGRE